MTGQEQIKELGKLKQLATAWLLGVDAGTVRGYATLPRNDDGSYDAREVVTWAAQRAKRPKLSNDDHELLLRAVDATYGHCDHLEQGILRAIDQLTAKYGDSVQLAFADAVLADVRFGASVNDHQRVFEPPTEESIRKQHEQERRDAEIYNDRALNLKFIHKCDSCGLVRHGQEWAKRPVPRDHGVINGICPECRSK